MQAEAYLALIQCPRAWRQQISSMFLYISIIIEALPGPLVYALFILAFGSQRQSWALQRSLGPAKVKLFPIWPLVKRIYQPLLWSFLSTSCPSLTFNINIKTNFAFVVSSRMVKVINYKESGMFRIQNSTSEKSPNTYKKFMHLKK